MHCNVPKCRCERGTVDGIPVSYSIAPNLASYAHAHRPKPAHHCTRQSYADSGHTARDCICHNYIGHKYGGHHYAGHGYTGRTYMSLGNVVRDCIGHNLLEACNPKLASYAHTP